MRQVIRTDWVADRWGGGEFGFQVLGGVWFGLFTGGFTLDLFGRRLEVRRNYSWTQWGRQVCMKDSPPFNVTVLYLGLIQVRWGWAYSGWLAKREVSVLSDVPQKPTYYYGGMAK